MKDSKEKEHRISNLKDMIDNVSEPDANTEENFDDIEEDIELINYLHEDYDDLEIDDEFIYHPGEDKGESINLEENPINEDYIINAPKEKELEDDSTEGEEGFEDFSDDISESFDNIINAKIGRTPILAIVSSLIGLLLIALSAYVFSTRSDRVIDNVVSGESHFMSVILLIFGLLLLGYGLFKIFGFKSPFQGLANSLDSVESDKPQKPAKKKEEEDTPKTIPKSNIPLDKESYKVGEFNIGDLKNKFKKPSKPKKSTPPTQEELDQIPPAREKSQEKKGLTTEEIEEIEYKQVVLDGESIDDIFAEVEDIEDMPIISIDSEDKKEK